MGWTSLAASSQITERHACQPTTVPGIPSPAPTRRASIAAPSSLKEFLFWQEQINDCRQRLAGLLPIIEHRPKAESLGYPPFLWHVLTTVEAAVAGDASERDLQKCFNLVPQSSNQALFKDLYFIQVTALNSHQHAMLPSSASHKPRISHLH